MSERDLKEGRRRRIRREEEEEEGRRYKLEGDNVKGHPFSFSST